MPRRSNAGRLQAPDTRLLLWDATKHEVSGSTTSSVAEKSITWRQGMSEILWKYEQLWAGQRLHQIMFNTREEAEKFVTTILQTEPDQMFSIEAIEVHQIWN